MIGATSEQQSAVWLALQIVLAVPGRKELVTLTDETRRDLNRYAGFDAEATGDVRAIAAQVLRDAICGVGFFARPSALGGLRPDEEPPRRKEKTKATSEPELPDPKTFRTGTVVPATVPPPLLPVSPAPLLPDPAGSIRPPAHFAPGKSGMPSGDVKLPDG